MLIHVGQYLQMTELLLNNIQKFIVRGWVISLIRRLRFISRSVFWYLFLLEIEYTPGPCAAGKIRCIEKKSMT
jgi:hypothetical protein